MERESEGVWFTLSELALVAGVDLLRIIQKIANTLCAFSLELISNWTVPHEHWI